ncbi:MerR family transcriptional regulator [Algihabitans albus]|uniref:helix-turn-helix domain-containing protein n=1 Tax=Algihabitans albus TaxID=2164067 RepID=UPI000E5D2A73|nr:helix-turn-helix domain-containing protein [Algihabitans albus]
MANFKKVAEAVAESGLSRAHIYRLIDQGKVPSQTEGRLRKVDVEALKRFVSDSASKPRRGRRPGSGKAAQAAQRKSTVAAQRKPAVKAARKTTRKTGRKTTGKAATSVATPAAPVAAKSAPARATTRRATGTRKAAAAKRSAAPQSAGGGNELEFLRGEVARLWGELDLRRQDQQAECDRLLKIIESLTRRA